MMRWALDVAGLALIVGGGAIIWEPAGWILAGLACLALSWRIESSGEGEPARGSSPVRR